MTQRDPETMFASRSVPVHLLRGVLGAVLVVAALALVPAYGGGTILLALPALWLWRGCPTCWTLGLIQTRACAVTSSPARPPRAPARGTTPG